MKYKMRNYKCADCGRSCRAWEESYCALLHLCSKCYDAKGQPTPRDMPSMTNER